MSDCCVLTTPTRSLTPGSLSGERLHAIDPVMAVVNADSRIPAGFAVFINPKSGREELAQSAPEKVLTDFKGIDHSDDNGVLAAVIEDVFSVLGG